MSDDLDPVWKALSDPTRRQILDLLRDGPKLTGDLVDQFPELSRFGVMKHIDVLREAKLVITRAEGRKRINSLSAAPIRAIMERWIGKYEAYWANTLLRIKDAAEDDAQTETDEKEQRRSGSA